MKKTNIRIQNFFIFEKGKKYYLTDIDQLEEWKETKTKDLKPFLKNDVTEKVNDFMKSYSSNVNFIVDNFKNEFTNSKEQVKKIVVKKGG
jgi:gas vesicle protein|tara:strand:- start:1064 stop:1333 length:270 start_codon:yes stop_codon:yes gene_type:complete